MCLLADGLQGTAVHLMEARKQRKKMLALDAGLHFPLELRQDGWCCPHSEWVYTLQNSRCKHPGSYMASLAY